MKAPETETEDVWTFNAEPEAGITKPIRTTCKAGEFGYPRSTTDGDRMFENTHFRTEAEAWARLLANVNAHENMSASDYRQAQANLQKRTERLAEVSAFAAEVRAAHDGAKP